MNTWPVGHYHQWSALMTYLHLYTYILYLDIIHIPKTHNSCVCLLQWIDVLSLLISDSLIEGLSPPSQPALAKAMLYARRPSLYPGHCLGWSRTIDFLYIANQCNKNSIYPPVDWIPWSSSATNHVHHAAMDDVNTYTNTHTNIIHTNADGLYAPHFIQDQHPFYGCLTYPFSSIHQMEWWFMLIPIDVRII